MRFGYVPLRRSRGLVFFKTEMNRILHFRERRRELQISRSRIRRIPAEEEQSRNLTRRNFADQALQRFDPGVRRVGLDVTDRVTSKRLIDQSRDRVYARRLPGT